MSRAERVAGMRDAATRARSAVAQVRALLCATERVLASLEAMLAAEIPNVVALRKALDALSSTRRESDHLLLQTVEAADRVQDTLGATTRLVVPKQ